MFTIGSTYTRNDIYEILSLPEDERGGDWLNGYHRHGEDYYIFCNVGVPGRTGHDYDNHWEGEKLSKRPAKAVLTGATGYSAGRATRQGSSSPTRFTGQSAITFSTCRR